MVDLSWLAQEARNIHAHFVSIFYILITTFLALGILIEYFKLPLGGIPSIGPLIGRALVAAILLHTFQEMTDTLTLLSDTLSAKLADPTKFDLIRGKMADKLRDFSFSWISASVKQILIISLSYVTFVIFHLSFYLADAFFLYCWTLLYVLSPFLIALFVLPATAPATGALYRSLFEISCWKPLWFILATLSWSAGLGNLNQPGTVSFFSVICYNLITALSLLAVPFLVHMLAKSGVSQVARSFGTIALGGITVGPRNLGRVGSGIAPHAYNSGLAMAKVATPKRYFPRLNAAIRKIPRLQKNGGAIGFKKNTSPKPHSRKKEDK